MYAASALPLTSLLPPMCNLPPYSLLFVATSFVVTVLITWVSMPWLLRLCKQRGLYDLPNERKVHHNKVPRMGGVLFMPCASIGMTATLLLMLALNAEPPGFKFSTVLVITGIVLIYLIGLLDDVAGLNANFKFVVQLVASLFLPVCNLYINNLYGFLGIYEVPIWVGYPLTVFISLLVVNAINLIDGIDGLSSSLCMLILGIYTVVFLQLGVVIYSIFSISLLGAVMVFFYFNMFGREDRMTKTFMGDTGSLILGYAIAFLSFKYAMDAPAVLPARPVAILFAFTLLIVPTFDLIRVAFGRLFRGEGIFTPDKTHIHHKFMAAGCSMRAALCFIVLLQVAFNLMNLGLYHCGVDITLIVAADVLLFTAVQWTLTRLAKARQA